MHSAWRASWLTYENSHGTKQWLTDVAVQNAKNVRWMGLRPTIQQSFDWPGMHT